VGKEEVAGQPGAGAGVDEARLVEAGEGALVGAEELAALPLAVDEPALVAREREVDDRCERPPALGQNRQGGLLCDPW